MPACCIFLHLWDVDNLRLIIQAISNHIEESGFKIKNIELQLLWDRC
jgi:hypothetical protein